MASSILLAAIVAALCVSTASAAIQVGGATSVNQYVPKLIANYNKGHPGSVATYNSVGSGTGISNFISGAYAIGFSDDPLNNAQNSAAGGTGKFTLPLTEGLYAVCTNKASGLRLRQGQLAGIYKGQITKWSQIRAGLTGTIHPIARSDSSGTTELFNIWLFNKLGNAWPFKGTASWQGQKGIGGDVKFYKGSGGVAGAAAKTPGSVCYVQAGIGVSEYHLKAFALINPAGRYVSPTGATDPQQSIPRQLPPSSASWAGVSLLDKPGAGTYPIASFVYMFARRHYGNAANARIVKGFLLYTQSAGAQSLASSYFFYRLPAKVTGQSIAAIKNIT